MKILHYINNLESGGAEKLLTLILPLMQKEGHEVHLAVSNINTSVPVYLEAFKKNNIKVFNFNCSAKSFKNFFKIKSLIKSEQYDVVHAHIFPTEYWLALASASLNNNSKLIKTEHRVTNRRRNYSFLRPIEQFIYKQYHTIIGITDEVSLALIDWLKSNNHNFVTINNGVDTNAVKMSLTKANIEQYNFLKKENINLLMAGRFRDDGSKDQKNLIKSLSHLPDHYHLYLAGEGETMEDCKQTVKDLNLENRVHFLGMRTDIYALMNLVDVNILASNFEGLSGVALESMSSSKPFIGSNVPGINDVVPNKDFLFEPKSPKSIAAKVIELTQDRQKYNELIKLGNIKVESFGIETMAKNYLAVYL